MTFTDREHEIIDEHFAEWFGDRTPDRDEVLENFAERIRETKEDEPELAAEFEAILEKYRS